MTKTKRPTPKSFRFTEDELAILEAAKRRHGSYKAAIVAALQREAGANATDWPAALRRLANELEREG
jgi:hypothetical protein